MKISLVLFVILLCGCNDNTPKHKPWNNLLEETAPMSNTPMTGNQLWTNRPFLVLNRSFVYGIEKNPDKHIGKVCAFQGTIISIREHGGVTVFQMLVSNTPRDRSYTNPVITVGLDSENIPIGKNSYVRVLGIIKGEIEGKNAFGGNVSNVMIKAIAVRYIVWGAQRTWEDYSYKTAYCQEENEYYKKWAAGEIFQDEDGIPE